MPRRRCCCVEPTCDDCTGCPWTVAPEIYVEVPSVASELAVHDLCEDIWCGNQIGIAVTSTMPDTSASPILRTIGCIVNGIDGTTPDQDVSPFTTPPDFIDCDELDRSVIVANSYAVIGDSPGDQCVYEESSGGFTYTFTYTPEIWFSILYLYVRVRFVCLEESNVFELPPGPYRVYEASLEVFYYQFQRIEYTTDDPAGPIFTYDCVGTTPPIPPPETREHSYLYSLPTNATNGEASGDSLDLFFVRGCYRDRDITLRLYLDDLSVDEACLDDDLDDETPMEDRPYATVALTF